METNLPIIKSAQSTEITNALQQYTKYVAKCWEKAVGIFREEVIRAESTGERRPGKLSLERICDINFLKGIDSKHPDRALLALKYISEHPIVIKKPLYKSINLIPSFEENEKGEYVMELSNKVITHYLAKDLPVKYDMDLVMSFQTISAVTLYKKACLFENRAKGFFRMSEEELRLTFSLDVVKQEYIENLEKLRIRDIEKLPIENVLIYAKFSHLIEKIIQPGINEINKAYEEDRCPFMMAIKSETVSIRLGKRGKPKQRNYLKFFIYDVVDTQEEVEVEYADAVEITPESIIPPPVADSQVEMALEFSDESEQTKALIKIREQITSILKDSKATHTKKYVNGIIAQIKGRLSNCPELPSMVLAWIKFSNDEIKANKGKASEVAKFIQANLKYHCQLFYKGSIYTGNKLPEYPPGYEPTVIRVTPSEGDNQTSQFMILNNNNYGRNKANSVEERRAKLDRDAEEARRRVMARPYIPKVH